MVSKGWTQLSSTCNLMSRAKPASRGAKINDHPNPHTSRWLIIPKCALNLSMSVSLVFPTYWSLHIWQVMQYTMLSFLHETFFIVRKFTPVQQPEYVPSIKDQGLIACVFIRAFIPDQSLLYNGRHLQFCYNHMCPGMFKCHNSYCIPVWYVCDGFNDCPSYEDESYCVRDTCLGLLICKEYICVTRQETCDGYIHCSESWDDEMHCNLHPCPQSCMCYGLTMVCTLEKSEQMPVYDDRSVCLEIHGGNFHLHAFQLHLYQLLKRLNVSNNSIT